MISVQVIVCRSRTKASPRISASTEDQLNLQYQQPEHNPWHSKQSQSDLHQLSVEKIFLLAVEFLTPDKLITVYFIKTVNVYKFSVQYCILEIPLGTGLAYESMSPVSLSFTLKQLQN